ncbi:MAG: pyridoxamine 5'-phosphate oxidase family protein [Acidobacteria bacterium]|nr:pyridoxamine 5'-phosphate oxidase family protein [Acidobacteriota bacterium]
MNSALEFLKANKVFHLATVDGSQARVRPFGFVMNRNGRLYMCTGKAKDVYKQMKKNPDIEISAMGADNTWLRVRGKIEFDDSRDTKVQAFEEAPMLLQIYPKGPDDGNYVTFYFTEARATLYSFAAAPKELPLL